MKIIYTKHAEEMLIFRQISKKIVQECVNNPDEILPAREGKKIYLKDFGKNYLKLVLAHQKDAFIVITTHWLAKKRAEV